MIPKYTLDTFNLKDIQAIAVKNALHFTYGNVQYARELLNISRETMYRLMRLHKIDYQAIREQFDRGQNRCMTKKINQNG